MSQTITQLDLDEAVRRPSGVTVHAGFPNPAADAGYNPRLSLDRLLVRHPSSSYFFRISGDAWAGEGIFGGDIALIDRALNPRATDLVVCWRDDTFVIVRQSQLLPDESAWGVISATIHQTRPH